MVVKWIKIAVDIFDDEKILLIEQMPDSYAIITIWFKLLCLAGKQNNSGVFLIRDSMPYTDEMFATIFRMPLNTVRLALTTFERFGMTESINDTVTIPNWGKHQSLDKIEKQNEYMREYMRGYREKQKSIANGEQKKLLCKPNSKTNNKTNVNTPDKDIDKELETDIDTDSNVVPIPKQQPIDTNKETKRKPTKIPPSIDEVTAYCKERQNKINPEHFIDYYTARGWMVGKVGMKDWKAAVRTWERNDKTTQASQPRERKIEMMN